jgi:hypothetical protein
MARCRCHIVTTWLALLSLLATLAACREKVSLLPKSGGRPFEVLVVGDRDSLLRKVLSADVEGLPQSEPSFDVSATDSAHFAGALRLARSIVTVNIDPRLYTTTRIRYEKNVYAKPQIMVYIGAPSTKVLAQGLAAQAPMLRQLLNRFEANAAIALLSHKRNIEAEKTVGKLFGVEMWIPMDMVSSKKGKDFLWLSNNSPTGMQNIVIYRSPTPQSTDHYIHLRDSVMRMHIKGETDAMFMHTVKATVTGSLTKEKERSIMVHKGLWEMEGDDMGGPFIAHTQGHLTVEAFVFAPGMKKRNLLRRTEAALYTLKQ